MTNEEKFVNELIGYIFAFPYDDYMTMECLCRKLHKHGLIEKKNGEWVTDFIERKDEPQTELVNDSPILAKDLVDDEFNPYDEECMRCKHLKLRCEFVPSYCKYEPKEEPQTEREGE
jgi:hypothetical protein